MRLILAAALLLTACTNSTGESDDVRSVREFADSVHGSECPTADCAASLKEEEELLMILTD